ncbi:MAG: fasciclin domain-containing protein [Saprospirales bacterium]|nr:fasciclin domain-containing protein [Saprospirales bacterium]
MSKFQSIFGFLLMGVLTFGVVSCEDDEMVDPDPEPMSIAEIAAGDDQFSTLVAALERVNLVSVLDGAGNFTVFAPTNTAFQALGVDLSTISDADLTEILLYHVLGGKVASTDLQVGQTYATTAAETGPGNKQLSILIEKNAGGVVTVNGSSKVTTADVEATNGVIHIVDGVLLPLDVVGHAAANSNFTELVGALGAANGNLVSTLQGEGPWTVFAPLNSAFEAISGVVAGLNADQLASVLTYHVVAGANVVAGDLTDGMMVTTVQGEDFTVNIDGANVTITDANGGVSTVVLTDVQATNGVIHVLNAVIIPMNL